jgi:serine/threonine protein kinase
MPKNKSSNCRSGCKKRNKRNSDNLYAHCTQMRLNEDMNSINSNEETNIIDDYICNNYYKDNHLLHTKPITEIDVEDYLTSRIYRREELDLVELDKTEKDCISFNEENNSVKINNELIDSKNITISKYISNGCYGVIFVSSDTDDGIIYVIKLILNNNENKNEIQTMKYIKNNNNTFIPNFINIAYYHLNCKVLHENSNVLLKGINLCLKNRQYAMLILEYFDGEIYSLLRETSIRQPHPISIEIKKCIYAQMLLSIYLLHNKFNYYHNDAHLKNFLYKKVNVNEKYFHYKITKDGESNDYYIKNEGYIVVLADFGLSKRIGRIEGSGKISTDDYFNILFEMKIVLAGKSDDIIIKFNDFFNKISKSNYYNEFEFLNFMMSKILDIKTTITDEQKINQIAYE